jgi:hypothetical protein
MSCCNLFQRRKKPTKKRKAIVSHDVSDNDLFSSDEDELIKKQNGKKS